ncbi:unnamed protein product [Symbiodinium necroappetens]|uniref:Reticulocyte-binding protein 2-like a n=1 Tax=Symbiodinium necroappetens TaxID=1628268 RepID=A0A812RJL1_9DINO|nr:unnamed protein product [Symbiodinium necroappetens]
MQAAEPAQFRRASLEALSCKSVRRVFYGMFRQPPYSRPTGKTKADIQEYLLREYAALGRPCAGKTVAEVLEQTEVLLSASLEFSVHETEDGKQYITCDNQSSWLPAGKSRFQTTVFRDSQKIPYITNGTESFYCVKFFSAPASSTALVPEGTNPIPLPSSASNAGSAPVPGMAPAKSSDPVEIPPPESSSSDSDSEGEVAGYVLKQIAGTPNFQVVNKGSGEIAPLREGIQDWTLEVCKKGKHKDEVFAGSPSTPKATCWLSKLTWARPQPPPVQALQDDSQSMEEWRKSMQAQMARESAEALERFRREQTALIQQERAEREKQADASKIEQDKKDEAERLRIEQDKKNEMERLRKEAAEKLEQDKKDEMERLRAETAEKLELEKLRVAAAEKKLEQDKKDEMERLRAETAEKLEQDKKDETERLRVAAAEKLEQDKKDATAVAAAGKRKDVDAAKPEEPKKDNKRKKPVMPP